MSSRIAPTRTNGLAAPSDEDDATRIGCCAWLGCAFWKRRTGHGTPELAVPQISVDKREEDETTSPQVAEESSDLIPEAKLDPAGRVRNVRQTHAPALPNDWKQIFRRSESQELSSNTEAKKRKRTNVVKPVDDGIAVKPVAKRDPLPPIRTAPRPPGQLDEISTTSVKPIEQLSPPQDLTHNASHSNLKGFSSGTSLRGSWNHLARTLRHAFSYSRENIITEPLRIFVGTWNMNARLPTGNISSFLGDRRTNTRPPFKNCQLLIIGTQECEERLETAGIRQPKEKSRWLELLKEVIGPRYVLVGTKTLVGLHLAIFVVRWTAKNVQDVMSGDVKVYLNGAKGAVGISFQFCGRSFCFINAHLKAHEGAVERRNADWKKINETMPLPGYGPEDGGCTGVVERFDYVFWMGDLNYRTNLGVNKVGLAKALLGKEEPEIGIFLANDELRRAYEASLIFPGFSEGNIKFKPTFKFDTLPGSPTSPTSPPSTPSSLSFMPGYDSSSKQRMPSYTDRILFRTRLQSTSGTTKSTAGLNAITALGAGLNQRVHVEVYTDCPDVIDSDHKPVYGIYRLDEELQIDLNEETEERLHAHIPQPSRWRRWLPGKKQQISPE
ncbi:uncharacterized protein SPPG_07104 [Spizellomyces punctatus DAOM BR117]|uniref:Inositol polyphosphate-related phosphatase domain-containing protein n=1 Tax=Spizellomyces punctatus (strain DAOM BR117) TaxID=645134 RepID=A0A0L0H7Z3_SPIPD|nr:uncharacterized protein SPPG_07104 [Spizellomyces punctatus DAOM BR117]KNC97635.1 hypothetical protein SPPG_07104 [Spizellomyces punctatus DAOM BR117]|eukprot:XP_016605675.1 hypothetical protein SPPG_07104 [Spizellomyces punctatus DAOM BR117]